MAKHSGILAVRTPWTVWKGKKIWHQKMSPPGWKVSNMLLGKSRGQLLIAMKWWDSITNSMYMNLSKLWEILKDRGAWRAEVHRVAKSWTQRGDWKTTTINLESTFIAFYIKFCSMCIAVSWLGFSQAATQKPKEVLVGCFFYED